MSDMAAMMGMGSWPPPYPDENRGPLLLRINWALISISSMVVLARIWTKFAKARRLYADDICMLVALVFGLIHAALLSKAIEYGLGRHMAYLQLQPDALSGTLKYGVFCLGWGFLSPMAGRIAFCVTMLYISGTDRRVNKWAKNTTFAFIALQIIINMLAFIMFYVQCGTHLDVFWDLSKMKMQPEVCLEARIQTDLGYFQGAFNCLTDLYLTVLPGILIEHTKLSIKKKIGLALLLCLSILALAASIVKTYEARALSNVLDYSYDLCVYIICIEIELNVVIVVSSIPLLRPLLTLFNKNHHRQRLPNDQPPPGWETSTMTSMFLKKSRAGSRLKALSTSSEENMVPHSSQVFYMEQPRITVTREVTVTYQPSDVQFVHAALVGLVQGEIANPKLAR